MVKIPAWVVNKIQRQGWGGPQKWQLDSLQLLKCKTWSDEQTIFVVWHFRQEPIRLHATRSVGPPNVAENFVALNVLRGPIRREVLFPILSPPKQHCTRPSPSVVVRIRSRSSSSSLFPLFCTYSIWRICSDQRLTWQFEQKKISKNVKPNLFPGPTQSANQFCCWQVWFCESKTCFASFRRLPWEITGDWRPGWRSISCS